MAFHPAHRSMLVSGSEDGLIAVFDTAPALGACARRGRPPLAPRSAHCCLLLDLLPLLVRLLQRLPASSTCCPLASLPTLLSPSPHPAPPDEDEGFKAALNIDTSVAQLGFYGRQGEKLWARSGVESLHLWEWAAACSEEAAGGGGALGEAGNARDQLTAAAAACPAGQALAPGLDYLVGCEYDAAADRLWCLAGTNGGAVGFFPVVEPASGAAAAAAAQGGAAPPLFGPPAAALPAGGGGAHTDVVRSVLWPGAAGGTCLTGGEDSKICVWSTSHAAAAGPAGRSQQQHREGGAARKHAAHGGRQQQQQHGQRRGAPY